MSQKKNKSHVVSDILREIRHRKGFSQSVLGERLGMERTYISLLETGKRHPSIEALIRIARALEERPGAVLDEIAARMDRER